MRIEISHEEELLDTGGGLKKAAWFFLEDGTSPFLLHNVDVISTIDLGRMVRFHGEQNALATMAVQDRMTSRPLLFDGQGLLCGRKVGGDGTPEMTRSAEHVQTLAFSGIHVISPRLFAKMNEGGAFSIIPAYLRLAGQGEKIVAFRADEYEWRDLGRAQNVMEAARELRGEH
jgi:NDP-sugar pyrophosphorylase family protein